MTEQTGCSALERVRVQDLLPETFSSDRDPNRVGADLLSEDPEGSGSHVNRFRPVGSEVL